MESSQTKILNHLSKIEGLLDDMVDEKVVDDEWEKLDALSQRWWVAAVATLDHFGIECEAYDDEDYDAWQDQVDGRTLSRQHCIYCALYKLIGMWFNVEPEELEKRLKEADDLTHRRDR